MSRLASLGLSAKQWKFLSNPEDYVISAAETANLMLAPESTARQFKTARDILDRLNGKARLKGVLLADDVGLGKTTVAALVAWIVASAGKRRGVRILAPNETMKRRWEEELLNHVLPLRKCAWRLDVRKECVKARLVGNLSPGSIQVVTHAYALSERPLRCDLLIIDEAHRAKGEGSKFSVELKRRIDHARRVLILTATPFSIEIRELNRMLELVGADASVRRAVDAYRKALDRLNSGPIGDARSEAKRLTDKATEAVQALSRFVIRHSVDDDLKDEQGSFGHIKPWEIYSPSAKPHELELLLRMDRARRLDRPRGSESSSMATNDARFHVGWRQFDKTTNNLSKECHSQNSDEQKVICNHVERIQNLRADGAVHPKMQAVGLAVTEVVQKEGEKVVLFCDHLETARELAVHLMAVLPRILAPKLCGMSVWKDAWTQVFKDSEPQHRFHRRELLETFIEWLSSDLMRAQTSKWIGDDSNAPNKLVEAFNTTSARHRKNRITIEAAAKQLYTTILDNPSSLGVLRRACENGGLDLLPGSNGGFRVLAVCESNDDRDETRLFTHSQKPDLVLRVFNSPFGPDVLVATDKLSEGIDLHRYCRHLIHYELDPSPIRTVQRNGRIRRVNSWAAATGEPVQYAYPAFKGSRDEKLVNIVRNRLASFSLLLGGVSDFKIDEVAGSDEQWRNDVIKEAKKELQKLSGRLVAREPPRADEYD